MDLTNQIEVNQLIKACLKGKRIAQNLLFKSVYGKMSAVCLRYADDKDEAKDMFQTGMIKVFKNLKKYNSKGSFEGWIRRIIVNNAIDYMRKKKNIYESFENNILYEEIEKENLIDLQTTDNPNISADKIIELIHKLSPAYRTVLNLFIVEEYSHKEIAEKLNISLGTSKSNLSKAKINLKKLLNQELVKIEK